MKKKLIHIFHLSAFLTFSYVDPTACFGANDLPNSVYESIAESLSLVREFNSSGGAPSNACSEAIPNGIKTDLFPAVVKFTVTAPKSEAGMCTATLIGKGTLLTAGHCLGCKDGKNRSTEAEFQFGDKTIKMKSAYCNPLYDVDQEGSYANVANDLAIVFFDSKQIENPPAYPSLALKNSKKRTTWYEEVTLVGFGMNDPTAKYFRGDGTKRTGTTHIDQATESLISVLGHYQTPGTHWYDLEGNATGKDVGGSHGDSGSAMFGAVGTVYGVLSVGGDEGGDVAGADARTTFCRLSSKASQNFFSEAKKRGANFNLR